VILAIAAAVIVAPMRRRFYAQGLTAIKALTQL
jgi:hypothetical protein